MLATIRFSALAVLLALPVFIGCSRQDEGERCARTNGNSDCEEGLICTEAASLRNEENNVDRCCPEPGTAPTDERCELRTTGGGDGDGDGDDSGVGGGGGMTSGEDPSSLGANCNYPSDCILPLVCGPGGVCQWECNVDRDCGSGRTCTAERICVSQ